MKKKLLMALSCLLWTSILIAQKTNTDNSLLWKITGNGLTKPSYLFGTYHFFSNGFVDTMQAVKSAYASAETVVGELLIDSTFQASLMEASMLKGTTLQQILPDSIYTMASEWFRKEAGVDFSKLDQLNPVTVITAALAITHQKYFPNKPGEVQLDTYFQNEARKDGKKVMGLETIQAQIKAMFGQFSLERQAELLAETFKQKDQLRKFIAIMNDTYISQNMDDLQQIMYGSNYKAEEMKILLDDRNDRWMKQLPGLMKEQSLFVAVGALHLVGNSGLITQLKKQGYTVTALNLN